jgi:hypothetical protein
MKIFTSSQKLFTTTSLKYWGEYLLLSPILPLLIFLIPTFWGIDFGYHWDENYGKIRSVVRALEDGIFLQGEYMHAGFNFILSFIPLIPSLLKMFLEGALDFQNARDNLVPYVISDQYKIAVRSVFIVFSSLTIPAVYMISMLLEKNRFQAFVASLAVAVSWEFSYHSRWAVADCILVTLTAFYVFCLILSVQRSEQNYREPLYWAAILAGLSAGTKYNGGVLLFFALALAFYLEIKKANKFSVIQAAYTLSVITGLFCLVFFFTSPAFLIHPFFFWGDLKEVIEIYKRGFWGAPGATVDSGPDHLFAMLRYFARDFFSHYQPIAFGMFGISMLGVFYFCKTLPRLISIILIGIPILYLLYFSQQSYMGIRNYLFVTPILAVCCGKGIVIAFNYATNKKLKIMSVAIFLTCIAYNIYWMEESANSITKRTPRRYDLKDAPKVLIDDLISYIKAHPDIRFVPSKLIREDLLRSGIPPLNNVHNKLETSEDFLVCYQSESVMQDRKWPGTGSIVFSRVIGPQVANMNYYARWAGSEWIYIIPRANFPLLPRFLPRLVDETPPPPNEDRLTHARWGYTHGL